MKFLCYYFNKLLIIILVLKILKYLKKKIKFLNFKKINNFIKSKKY